MEAANRSSQSIQQHPLGQEITFQFSTVPNKVVSRELAAVDRETLGPTNWGDERDNKYRQASSLKSIHAGGQDAGGQGGHQGDASPVY